MWSLIVFVLAVIALVRTLRLEREFEALRKRLDATDSRGWRSPKPEAAPAAAATPPSSTVPSPVSLLEPGSPSPTHPLAPPPLNPGVAVPPAPSEEGDPEALERRIGERLLLYAGMIVLVLGVAFFLRYAFEHEWMSPAVRVLVGGLGGALLVGGGRWLARHGFRQYGLFLSGGGLAVLFLSAYAAFAFYGLIGQAPAFALLAAIAIVAAALADREASLPLALMAVCGGFVTPFLVGGGSDAQITLFSYDAVLIAATMFLAHRRRWPWLNLASFALTVVTVAAWAGVYYDEGKYLRTELFLTLYCAMFAAILRENRRSTDAQARVVSAILWCAPVLYHASSLAILQTHGAAFLVYVILLSVALIVASIEASSPMLRLLGWAAVMLPLVAWIQIHHDRELLVGAVTTSVGIWVIFLATLVWTVRRGDVLAGWDLGLLHASGIGVFVALYIALQGFASPRGIAATAAGLALVNGGLWALFRRAGPGALHWLGVASGLSAIAVAVGFEGQWTVVMWSAEAAVVLSIGARLDREWFRLAALALFAIAIGQWLQSDPPESNGPFLVLLNARALGGLTIIGFLYVSGWVMRGVRVPLDTWWTRERAVLLVTASVLTVLFISLEITSYWAVLENRGVDADLARQLMLSASWSAYAAGVIVLGMRYHYPPVRYFAIALFGLTLVKVFAVDIQQLGGIYRVVAFLVVGAILLLVSFMYQKARR